MDSSLITVMTSRTWYNKAMIKPNNIKEFWDRIDKSDDCWEWSGYRDKDGYGRLWINGEAWGAHRLSWAIANGTIPEELHVCHTCDNPSCVNTAHLFIGTHKDNALDAVRKGRWATRKGEANGQSKLTEQQVLAIREEYENMPNKNQSALARKWGITQHMVHFVVTRKSWNHI